MSTIDEQYLQKILRTINHDMSAALRSSVGFSALILSEYDDQLDDKAKKWLRLNVDQGKKTQTALVALSEYSRLYDIADESLPCDLNALAHQACNELELAGLQVDIKLSASITGHPLLWKDYFYQLIQNSHLHSGATHCVISEQCSDSELTITVEDNGTGLDEHKAAEALLPFRTLGDAPGAGLGLARAKRIAEIHNGQIKLTPAEAGLCVEACLPRDIVLSP